MILHLNQILHASSEDDLLISIYNFNEIGGKYNIQINIENLILSPFMENTLYPANFAYIQNG